MHHFAHWACLVVDLGPSLAVCFVGVAVYFPVGTVVVNSAHGGTALGYFRLLDRSMLHMVALEMVVERGIAGRASELAVS
jgi:hypothetical protein